VEITGREGHVMERPGAGRSKVLHGNEDSIYPGEFPK
jgi:hypothetical protein